MSKLSRYIGSQFGNPRGIVGRICCFLMNRINNKMYDAVAEKMTSEKHILDIGYGNGYLVEKMYKKTNAKIDGIDISQDMKAAAEKRNESGVNKGDISLYIGDCCALQFDDNKYDAVTTVNTIYFWEDTVKGLKEIRRVLKDGGVFYNAVYSKQWLTKTSYTKDVFKLFEKEEYIKLAEQAGFSNVNITDIMGTSFFTLFPILCGSGEVFRIGSSIIQGVGFLCSGVIFKDSGTVRGMNTAATLWCTAAIGILASTQTYYVSITATAILICSNLIFRPIAIKIRPIVKSEESEKQYRISVLCHEDIEHEIRLLLINNNNCKTLYLNNLESGDAVGDKVEIIAEYLSSGKSKNNVLEGIVGKALKIPEVIRAGWEVL